MKQILIVYYSKYGATEAYAKVIGQRLNAPCLPLGQTHTGDLLAADTVALGTGLYGKPFAFSRFFRKHADLLREKRLVVFAVGALPEAQQGDGLHPIFQELPAGTPVFYLRGVWDPEAMGMLDRAYWDLALRLIQKKDPPRRSEREKAMLALGRERKSFVNLHSADPVIAYIKSLYTDFLLK